MDSPKIEHALVSVSDKTGLVDFARGLVEAGIQLVSTGGSRKCLEEAGVPVRDIADYTGFPEMMDGRLKTLHPKVHGGILCRRDNPDDLAALAKHGIVPFELVVVNLYPFVETVSRPGITLPEAIEQIDIGGPTLIRAAAKNHSFVTVASDPRQYGTILEQVRGRGSTTLELRRELAGEAFAHTAAYDTAIATYFAGLTGERSESFPERMTLSLTRRELLRYGENPHQSAALYASPDAAPEALVNAKQLHGKELSYNNWLDLDAAVAIVRSLPRPAVAVLKHNNPCGAATAADLRTAIERAWDGDPVSAFGSILGFNVPVDAAAADFLAEPGRFVEAMIAPEFSREAIEVLTTKPKWKANVRLLAIGELLPGQAAMQLRAIDGGYLAQNADDLADDESQWQIVTDAKPTAAQLEELRFAWAACRHVKSNAIVLVRDGALVGVGAGQMSRLDSVEIAAKKAGDRARGAVMASDAFFPFDDSIHTAAAAGVVAAIQPGGSKRDAEVIAACNQREIAMIFTGRRHFRH